MARTLLFLVFFFQVCILGAQDTLFIIWTERDDSPKLNTDSILILSSFQEISSIIDNLTRPLIDSGYYAAGPDSLTGKARNAELYLSTGSRYTLITQSGSEGHIIKKVKDPRSLMGTVADTVKKLGEMGFPMATAKYRVIGSGGDTIVLEMLVDHGPRLRFGGFEHKGVVKPEIRYLQGLTRYHTGDLYSDSLFRMISTHFAKSEVYQLNVDPSIRIKEFSDSSFIIVLDIKQRKNSSIWGLAGLTPGQAEGSLKLTGEAQANIAGLMNHGDIIMFRWSSPGKGSQELKARLTYPYLLGTRFGYNVAIQFKKIDTLYFNQEIGGALFYESSSGKRSGVKLTRWSSSGLGDIQHLRIRQMAGLTFQSVNLDVLFNPAKGHSIDLAFESGITKVKGPDEAIDSALNRIAIQGMFGYYRPISKLLVLHAAIQGATLLGASVTAQEMFRIGGSEILRGFDEESQIVASYAILTTAIRIRPDDNTYFGAFWDASFLFKENNQGFYHGFGIEAGIGIPAGMMKIQYVLGKQASAPLRLDAGRVHVGLEGRF